MKPDAFKESLSQELPPATFGFVLKALWYDAKGDWQKAHELVQDEAGKDAALIHAYLHRREGDIWNANYWYAKAGDKRPSATLEEEWEQLVMKFLSKHE